MKQLKLTLIVLSMTLTIAFGQKQKQSFPLKIAVLDESIALPNFWFTRYTYNPSMMVGTEYIWKRKTKSEIFFTGNVGFYYHKDWQAAVFLNSGIGYRYDLGRFHTSLQAGIGYAQVFSTTPVYKFQDGKYVEGSELGSPKFMPFAAFELGYVLKKDISSPELFVIYQFAAEFPFNFYTGEHLFVGAGIKFYPFNKKSNTEN